MEAPLLGVAGSRPQKCLPCPLSPRFREGGRQEPEQEAEGVSAARSYLLFLSTGQVGIWLSGEAAMTDLEAYSVQWKTQKFWESFEPTLGTPVKIRTSGIQRGLRPGKEHYIIGHCVLGRLYIVVTIFVWSSLISLRPQNSVARSVRVTHFTGR